MKPVVFSLILGLFASVAHAEVDPSIAFTQAYEAARDAVVAKLNVPAENFAPGADISRKKNISGQFGDFIVTIGINRMSMNEVSECEVKIFVQAMPGAENLRRLEYIHCR